MPVNKSNFDILARSHLARNKRRTKKRKLIEKLFDARCYHSKNEYIFWWHCKHATNRRYQIISSIWTPFFSHIRNSTNVKIDTLRMVPIDEPTHDKKMKQNLCMKKFITWRTQKYTLGRFCCVFFFITKWSLAKRKSEVHRFCRFDVVRNFHFFASFYFSCWWWTYDLTFACQSMVSVKTAITHITELSKSVHFRELMQNGRTLSVEKVKEEPNEEKSVAQLSLFHHFFFVH